MEIHMPLFVLKPAELKVLELLLKALGEPTVELEISVGDKEKFAELFKPEVADRFTANFECEVSAERALQLYEEYFRKYTSLSPDKEGLGSRVITSFKARWHGKDYTVKFNGFELEISTDKLSEDMVKLLNSLKGYKMDIGIKLGKPL